ncbi:serine/threonine protein kinase, partial [Klebsiella pneumoniae]|nr:serine/threonine protein kinase [Klebsiella pneumoniae]
DFGLVKEMSAKAVDQTHADGIAGTPLFMAPEQAEGDGPIDQRADLYALGGVAFYMLTGRPPFERSTVLGTMLAHANEPAV